MITIFCYLGKILLKDEEFISKSHLQCIESGTPCLQKNIQFFEKMSDNMYIS